MATISNTPRPGYAWDATDNCWYPIGTGPHTHSDYISQSTAINPTIVDAKGDIITATAADTPARLAVGSNGQILTADSTTSTGIKWGAAPSSALTLTDIASGTLSGATVTISSLTQDFMQLRLKGAKWNTGASTPYVRLNGDTSSIYEFFGTEQNGSSVYKVYGPAQPAIYLSFNVNADNGTGFTGWTITLQNCKTTGYTTFTVSGAFSGSGGIVHQGIYKSSSQITSLVIGLKDGYTWNDGTYELNGA